MTERQRRELHDAFRLQAIYETYVEQTGQPIKEGWKIRAERRYMDDAFFRRKVDLRVSTLMKTLDSILIIT